MDNTRGVRQISSGTQNNRLSSQQGPCTNFTEVITGIIRGTTGDIVVKPVLTYMVFNLKWISQQHKECCNGAFYYRTSR